MQLQETSAELSVVFMSLRSVLTLVTVTAISGFTDGSSDL